MKDLLMKKVAGCIFIALSLAGCVGLDVTPTDKFTDGTYWTSEEKAASLLHMAYRQMNSPSNIFRDERLSDNLFNGYGGDDVKVITNGQAMASTGIFNSTWGDTYGGIKTTHTLLANIDRITGMDGKLRNRMKAEARFIRAFLYFQLTNWYGDVPFFTKDITMETAKTISRTPQSEIVLWLHQELEEIAEMLPTKEQYAKGDRGRITCGAAMALNARIALNFNDWERVKKYTEKLINGTEYGQYSLFPNYQELFFRANEYNDEIMLDIQHVPEFRTWGDLSVFVPFSLPEVQYTLATPTQGLIDTYLMKDGSKWDEKKHDAYRNRDPRMDMTIIRHQSEITTREGRTYTINIDPNDVNNDTNDKLGRDGGTQTGYFMRKYYDINPIAWTAGAAWNCNTNFVVIRFADVLLMYAEAMNELGEMDNTVWEKTIKKLRIRAGFDNTPAAMDMPAEGNLREIIRNERRVELAMEGLRVYDLRRWKTAHTVMSQPVRGAKFKLEGGQLVNYTYSENRFNEKRDYLWAVPRQQLIINPNLGQNPGY